MNRRRFVAILTGLGGVLSLPSLPRVLGGKQASAPGETSKPSALPEGPVAPPPMKVGDPGWMHPDSPVAREIAAAYKRSFPMKPSDGWFSAAPPQASPDRDLALLHAYWQRSAADLAVQEQRQAVVMCTCTDILTCDHPWPEIWPRPALVAGLREHVAAIEREIRTKERA